MGDVAAAVKYLGDSLTIVDLRTASEFFPLHRQTILVAQKTLGKTQAHVAETLFAPFREFSSRHHGLGSIIYH